MIKSKAFTFLALLFLSFTSSVAQAPSHGKMTVQLELLNPSSEINNGIAKVLVQGGSAPYQYKWSNVDTPLDASESVGLIEGMEHSVVITDASGNTVTKQFTIPAESITEIFNSSSTTRSKCLGSRSLLGCFCHYWHLRSGSVYFP